MKRTHIAGFIAAVITCGAASVVCAAEQSSAAPAGAAMPASSMTSAEGTITWIDAQSTVPSLKLATPDGQTWTLALDAKTTSVWQSGQMAGLDILKKGDHVNVRYMVKDDQNWAKSIKITAAKPAATLPATSSEPTKSTY